MSEEILKVFLSDMDIVRVVCQHCKTAIEIKISELGKRTKLIKCPVCPQPFALVDRDDEFPSNYDAFLALQKAFCYFKKLDDKGVSIEFPVKVGSQSPKIVEEASQEKRA